MNNDSLETKLSNLKEQVSLSMSEKQVHRDVLRSFMNKSLNDSAQATLSPFQRFFLPMRYVVVGLSVFLISGVSVVSSAGNALPGEALYAVKLRVTEPLQILLTFDNMERAELESRYAERRLEEFSTASIQKKIDAETTMAIATSFNDHINGIQDTIADLQAEGAYDEALAANTDLRSRLRAHQIIIDKIGDTQKIDASSLATIVDTELIEAEVSASEITASASDPADDSAFSESLREHRNDAEQIILDIRSDISSDNETLDADDRRVIEDRINLAEDAVRQADEREDDKEDRADALVLYAEARNVLTELKTLIDADQTLGIDIIEE